MAALLGLIPGLPLAGFLVLGVFGRTMSRRLAAAIGTGLVGLSAALTTVLAVRFAASPPPGGTLTTSLWTWFEAGGLSPFPWTLRRSGGCAARHVRAPWAVGS